MLTISNFNFVSERQFEQEETAIVTFDLQNDFDLDIINISLQYDLGGDDIRVLAGSDMAVPSLGARQTTSKRVLIESDQAAETGPRSLKVDATFEFAGSGTGTGTFAFTLVPD